MRLLGRLILSSLLFVAASSAFASAGDPNAQGQPEDQMTELATYLLNLGAYLGYNLQVNPTATTGAGANNISQTLLNLPSMQVITNYLFNSYLGALLVNTAAQGNTGQGTTQFVPTSLQAFASINAFANYTFTTPPYASPAVDQVSVSTLLDQPPYQHDPVSQSVLNILGTPDFSYCLDNAGTTVLSTCSYPTGTLDQNQVMLNSIGTIPSTQTYFANNQIQPLLGQLNSNSLITPLLYSTTNSITPATSSSPGTPTNQGLVAQSQAQQAINFIRFVTGAVSPIPMPNRMVYDSLYVKARNLSKTYSLLEQQQAQSTLAAYLISLRVYAAQSSVAISNLYYILSRRLPQNQSTSSTGQQTSQALSEFTMATWRLYNPDQTPNKQWLAQINNASAATVQKEMAAMLAEINYQLYLSRQQQERILLTNSLLLLQNARNTRPNANLNAPTSSTIPIR